jgi:hypothetical protein
MAAQGYVILAQAFSITTGTGKTSCNIIAAAAVSATITQISASVAQTTGRCLLEIYESTQATAGTAGASTGAKQTYGFGAADTTGPGCTYGLKYTAEPTVLTVLDSWWFPCPGPFVLQFPLGREHTTLFSGATKYKAIGIRLSVDTGTVNSESSIRWEE